MATRGPRFGGFLDGRKVLANDAVVHGSSVDDPAEPPEEWKALPDEATGVSEKGAAVWGLVEGELLFREIEGAFEVPELDLFGPVKCDFFECSVREGSGPGDEFYGLHIAVFRYEPGRFCVVAGYSAASEGRQHLEDELTRGVDLDGLWLELDCRHRAYPAPRTAAANALIFEGSFTPSVSTPVETSTPEGWTAAMASATFSGVRPPARVTR